MRCERKLRSMQFVGGSLDYSSDESRSLRIYLLEYLDVIMVYRAIHTCPIGDFLMPTPLKNRYTDFQEPLDQSEDFLKQFFESCFASDFPALADREMLLEIAARNNISECQLKEKIVKLGFGSLCIRLVNSYILVTKLKNIYLSYSGKSLRKHNKKLKRFLLADIEFNSALTELVEKFWIYLPLRIQNKLGDYTYSLFGFHFHNKRSFLKRKVVTIGNLSPLEALLLAHYESIDNLIDSVSGQDLASECDSSSDDESDHPLEYDSEWISKVIERSKDSAEPKSLKQFYEDMQSATS